MNFRMIDIIMAVISSDGLSPSGHAVTERGISLLA